jgi:hypothetical protein
MEAAVKASCCVMDSRGASERDALGVGSTDVGVDDVDAAGGSCAASGRTNSLGKT